jgi:GT2 family glycosyltransferase
MSKVSISLVTWNGEKYIENCLNSVFNQTFKDFSVVLIDNGSHDQTLELLAERFPQLKVVRHKENIGFSKAYNQTIHWSKSEYVLCLNQDVVLEPTFLAEAVKFLDEHPLTGSIAGKIYRLQDNQKTKYIDSVGLRILKNYRVLDIGTGELDDGQYDIAKEVFGVSGAVPVYRRKALDEIAFEKEYFDEDFFSYKEDVDLSHRLILSGWECWRVPTVVAYHDRTVTIPTNKLTKLEIARNRKHKSRFANFHSYRNHLFFIYKNLPKFSLRFLWPIFWYELLKFFYVFFRETKNMKAWSNFFQLYHQLKLKRTFIQKNRKLKDEELATWLE